jgi:hypothetical protein
MQTIRQFLDSIGNPPRAGAAWVAKLCKAGRMPGAQLLGNVWILPDNAALPQLLKPGRKPWKHQSQTVKGEL